MRKYGKSELCIGAVCTHIPGDYQLQSEETVNCVIFSRRRQKAI